MRDIIFVFPRSCEIKISQLLFFTDFKMEVNELTQEGIINEIKSKVLSSEQAKKIKQEIKDKQREKLTNLMIAKSKDIMVKHLIEGFAEFYPYSFSANTIKSIYNSVLIVRLGKGFEIKIFPNKIEVGNYRKTKIDSFWTDPTISSTLEEDDDYMIDDSDDEMDLEDMRETEEIGGYGPYNNFERQGLIMGKDHLCSILYNEAMKEIEETFAGMINI